MKIKILEVSENSSHFKNSYNLVGTIGNVVIMEDEANGDKYVELEDCQVAHKDEDAGVVDGVWLAVFCKKIEIIEE